MAATVQIFNNSQRVAVTSNAYDCKITHELMRCYMLEFNVVNSDAARKYILPDVTTFLVDGQKYDIIGFRKQSGSQGNTTAVTAEHVGYRLLNYTLAAGYSFVGTVAQLAQDILNNSKNTSGAAASTEFSIGTTPDLGTLSFSLNNTDSVTAKYALMALKNIGAESDYDNFTVNFATKIGSGNSETFEFGVNMSNVSITYDKFNGTTYEVDIADLQRIGEGHVFDIGDTVTVKDSITNESFSKRIITYTRFIDNPAKNSITLGVFVSDVATQTAQMSIDIDTAQSKADNSVQVGVSYNSVKISHDKGFESNAENGVHREFNNGTDGDVIQQYYNGNWVTVWQAAADGTVTSYNVTHTLKTVMGGSIGFALYKGDGSENWTLVNKFDAVNGLNANRLTTLGSSTYGVIGHDDTYGDGIIFYDIPNNRVLKIYSNGGIYSDFGSISPGNMYGKHDVIIHNDNNMSIALFDGANQSIDLINGAYRVSVFNGATYFQNGWTGTIPSGARPTVVGGIVTGYTT